MATYSSHIPGYATHTSNIFMKKCCIIYFYVHSFVVSIKLFLYNSSEVSQEESRVAATNMDGLIEDLGVAPLPDASPTTK